MPEFTTTVRIAAPAERVWRALIDVERWPEWTPSVRCIERLDAAPLGVGSRVRIVQPKLPPAIWTVTDWRPERGFTWESRRPGVVASAVHAIERAGDDTCQVTLSVRLSGPLAPLAGLLSRGLTTRYLGFEAAGLKRWCEERA